MTVPGPQISGDKDRVAGAEAASEPRCLQLIPPTSQASAPLRKPSLELPPLPGAWVQCRRQALAGPVLATRSARISNSLIFLSHWVGTSLLGKACAHISH